jgi:hypothetical protein
MDPRDLSDDQLDQLAQQLAGRLPTGTHGDNVVLSRRQFALAASGVLSAGALTALGVDEASAQAAAGQVGTASEPVDAFAYNLDVANAVTSSLPMNGNDIENAGSVSTEELFSPPAQTLLQATDSQTIPSGANTLVTFDTIGDDQFGLADLSNNAIQIPSNPDFSHIRCSFTLQWLNDPTNFASQVLVDGSAWPQSNGQASMGFNLGGEADTPLSDTPTSVSGWLGVSGDETIQLEVTQESGSGVDLRKFATWFAVEVQ